MDQEEFHGVQQKVLWSPAPGEEQCQALEQLPREAVESLSREILKTQLNVALSKLL